MLLSSSVQLRQILLFQPKFLTVKGVRMLSASSHIEFARLIDNFQGCVMPSKNGSKQTPYNNFQVEFVTLKLEKSDKAAFDKWSKPEEHSIDVLLTQALFEGKKISLSYDQSNSTFIVSMTARAENDANKNKCIVSRAGEWQEAMHLTLYKAYGLLADKVWPVDGAGDNWG